VDIYFACSITGGRQAEAAFQVIVRTLEKAGHTVPTAHLSEPDVLAMEKIVAPKDVYQRDIAWITNAQALVAEVSTPSHGVGYEIAYALSIGKPVLCCYLHGTSVSKMITGNTHPNLRVKSYQGLGEIQSIVKAFLQEVSQRNISVADEVNNITVNK
jgi:2'-deoxynucleoside 5'-phosphate N-hydrolase